MSRKVNIFNSLSAAFVCPDADVTSFFAKPELSSANLATMCGDLGITYNELKEAVCDLITGLKTASLYTRLEALYFYFGNSANSMKWNFINQADTNAAFRLTFAGGNTYDSFGWIPNGTNGYANTYIVPDTLAGTPSNFNFGWYSRTNDFTTPALYGAYTFSGGNRFARHRTDSARYDLGSNVGSAYTANPSTRLQNIMNTSANARFYRDKAFINTMPHTGNLPTSFFFLGAFSNTFNNPGFFMPHQRALDFVATGTWTIGEIDTFNTLIDDFIIAINRNV